EIYPFQEISKRRGRKNDLVKKSEEIPITLFLFDILYLNGNDLSRKTNKERRILLEKTILETDKIKLAKRIVSGDIVELNNFFDSSIAEGCEGIVAKNIGDASFYRAGARGWLWIKYKRDYKSEINDSFDLVVIGAFWGHGRRAKTYGALLLANYNREKEVFETFCKLGTGFTDDVLFSLPRIFSDSVCDEKPSNVDSKLTPDVWIYPEKIMEVKGAEITISPVHTCALGVIVKGLGLALRFPRFTGRWREDKKPENCTDENEILEMYKIQKKNV
ncbi:DNA ligase I, ATP-dependent Dnl1, partial [mine drainage metagenome]